jgi:hypothetical protein
MNPRLLLPCSACFRHVRVDSGACPFCGFELPRWFGALAAPLQPRRTTRAGAYSHTAAASLLAAAACGGLVAGTNADGGDATVPDGRNGDTSSSQDASVPPGDGDVLDAGDARTDAGGGLDAADAGPCDSGPAMRLDACGDVQCMWGSCFVYECQLRCPPAPPYGKAFIED